ncbi:MAG TPA: pyruvate dehydrogenase complex E1 component subunit beta [Candidatus Megaira endosymbiont of Hartmannula sinica]|nr:pyruvate dehydrogenase complex E1 component subunit beta [Candidatus Megaera endosymbiont of Hartmannula sinica]
MITVREALNLAMSQEMEQNQDVFIMGEEVARYQGAYKVTQGMVERFGEDRVIDMPITEHGFAGFAVGSAFRGLRPIVEFMTFNFSNQAFDQIINSAAKTYYMSGGMINCPIVFRGPNGAASAVAAQHSQNYAALYSHIPGLKVVSPYSAIDYARMMVAAIRDNNPVIFLENEILYGRSFDQKELFSKNIEPIDLGKANIVKKGKDLTITAYSIDVEKSLQAAEVLFKEHGIDAEVIDLRTIKPLDEETIINSVKKTSRLINVDEGWFQSGISATITSIVQEKAFDYLDSSIININAKDVPLPYAQNLEKMALPSVQDIIEAAITITQPIK